jgi:hypothetical protein
VDTEAPKYTERILFLLKIYTVERPTCGLTTTKVGQTASYCNVCGLTAIEGRQTARLCNAHGLTANTSSGQNLKLKVVVATVAV